MKRDIELFDTSLRDGAQTPGINFNPNDKLEIAKKLDEFGIDYIEAGFAASSEADKKVIEEIIKNTENAIIVSLARLKEQDIDIAIDSLKSNVKRALLHIFIGTSPMHRKKKLKMTKKEILIHIENILNYIAKTYKGNISLMFSPEDALRTEEEFLFEVVDLVSKNGVKIINIPDTVGYAQPFEIYALFIKLKNEFGDKVKFSIHTHNDLGNAVANTLAAIKAGVEIVQGTFPPAFGERAGNADLIQVLLNLAKRKDYFNVNISKYNLKQIGDIIKVIEQTSGKTIPEHYPIVGRLVHSHSSGIHQDGVSKDSRTYEIIFPEEIGLVIEQNFILTNQSGRKGLGNAIKQYFGLNLVDEVLNEIFKDFKKLSSEKKVVTMEDIYKLLLNHGIHIQKKINIVWGGLNIDFTQDGVQANIVFKDNSGNEKFISDKGVGPVDAIFKVFNKFISEKFNFELKLLDFKISALGLNSDVEAKVYIKVLINGKIYEEYGIDKDIVKASVKALLGVINRI